MSFFSWDCKVVKKQDCLIELFSLKLLEANYMADPQLEAIRDMLVKKEPNFAEAARAMGGYLVPLDGRAAGHSHSVTPTHHQSTATTTGGPVCSTWQGICGSRIVIGSWCRPQWSLPCAQWQVKT